MVGDVERWKLFYGKIFHGKIDEEIFRKIKKNAALKFLKFGSHWQLRRSRGRKKKSYIYEKIEETKEEEKTKKRNNINKKTKIFVGC